LDCCIGFFSLLKLILEKIQMIDSNLFRPSVPKVKTNKGYILFKLLRGHLIDNKQMKAEIDTCYGAARISELRSDGWEIDDRSVHTTNGEKKEVCIKKYFLSREKISNYLQLQEIQDFLYRANSLYSK
jgi:hypothetical protein